MQMNNRRKNNGRKNKGWLRNPDQLKTPKCFTVKMVRMPDKSFHLIGGHSTVFMRRNQYRIDTVPVDVRDLAVELNNSRILAN